MTRGRTELLVVQARPVDPEKVLHLLDDGTRARLTAPGRSAAASAHALLRWVLTDLTGTDARQHVFARRCGTCGGPHGKPVLTSAALHTSLAYTDDVVVVAVTAVAPVGIDVEAVRATDFAGFDDVALAPGESTPSLPERARLWTRKEAVLKAAGTGLAVDPRAVDVRRRATRAPVAAQIYDVPVVGEVACAAAVLGKVRPQLRVEQRRLSPRAPAAAAPPATA